MSAPRAGEAAPGVPFPLRKLTILPLVAATYFMVAGGPYGLEDIVQKAGYGGAIWILLLTPLLWSLPTALVVSELASALPEEGGFYAWVRRAMGPFWGFQESWLTLAGSFFDMAIYPTLFVWYLSRFAPWTTEGMRGLWVGLGMIAVCTAWNLLGARAVGGGSVLMGAILLGPFFVLTVYALFQRGVHGPVQIHFESTDFLGGILVAMWNYMGWDNVSTVAGEVERPQRTYPRVMAAAVLAVVISYLLPVLAVMFTGIASGNWSTGGWVDIGRTLGGEGLAVAITLGGMIGAVGSFAALMMSLSRLPLVMAQDGFLPRVFTRTNRRTGAPWVAILACAVVWAFCFPLGFERLVLLDVLLTGLSILLEFVALVVLRIREPQLARPYRIPGGTLGAVLIGLPPLALMIVSVVRNREEQMGSFNALTLGLALIAVGPLLYWARSVYRSLRSREG